MNKKLNKQANKQQCETNQLSEEDLSDVTGGGKASQNILGWKVNSDDQAGFRGGLNQSF